MNVITPRNYTVIEIPKHLHQEIKPYAVSVEKSVKAVVIEALTEFMQKIKKEIPKNNVTQVS